MWPKELGHRINVPRKMLEHCEVIYQGATKVPMPNVMRRVPYFFKCFMNLVATMDELCYNYNICFDVLLYRDHLMH